MNHVMNLNQVPFDLIASGKKTIEARLFDTKRQKVDLGDAITFQLTDDASKAIQVKVVGLLRYETFGDMFAHTDVRKFGGTDAESMTEIMLRYYPQSKQDAHGVLGIEFAVIL